MLSRKQLLPERNRNGVTAMTDVPDPLYDQTVSRLLRREALRRAAADLNTASPPALESTLARISAEVTEEAAERLAQIPPPA